MATKIFPTVNDVGGSGGGKTISESNLSAYLDSFIQQPYVVSGMVPPATSANLVFALPVGECVISGYRVVTDAILSVTVTASNNNYIYLQLTRDGSQNVTGVGITSNTTGVAPTDGMLVAMAVAGVGAITSVVDRREFEPTGVISSLAALKRKIRTGGLI